MTAPQSGTSANETSGQHAAGHVASAGDSLWDIPELMGLNADRGIIRIPMERDVPFSKRVRALVDTCEFRRLSNIKQLGLASLVYPGATHTRFEHALGVFHNALSYLRQLGKDPRFSQIVTRHQAEVLMAAALLHDLGHWPYCHPIEDMGLADLPPHEEFAETFLAPGSEIAQVLEREWKIDPTEVLDVLVKRTESPSLNLLRSILSGPIDIDKMDYLDRDSLHAGVPYGRNYDKNRLMQSLLLNEAGDGLAISEKGKTAAELMVFARYVMFSEVYWHHTVRSATCMFARAFYHLYQKIDLHEFFQKNEWETQTALCELARGTSSEPLVEGIFGPRRQIYKRMAELSLYQATHLYQKLARKPYAYLVRCAEQLASELSSALNCTVNATDVVIDSPPQDREVEFLVDIYYPKEKVYRPLHEVSPVVESLAHTQFDDYVKRVRVFIHPRHAAAVAESGQLLDCLERALSRVGKSDCAA